MWHPVIDILEKTLNEGKTKKDKILESTYVLDVFSDDVLDAFAEAVFIDEKERLVHRDWAIDNPEDKDVKLYLSLTDELKDRITDKWAHEYSFFAVQSTMENFLEEFENYIDSVHDMDVEYEVFVNAIESADYE